MSMPSIICEVLNKKGMHARAAAQIVSLICQHDVKVTLTHNDTSAGGDSLLKLLTLNAPKGSKILIQSTGKEAEVILKKLQLLFSEGFGE